MSFTFYALIASTLPLGSAESHVMWIVSCKSLKANPCSVLFSHGMHFRLFQAYNFFMEKSHFFMIGDFDVIFSDFFGWDWGTPAILRQNPNKITVLCGCGFGFKSWDWVRPPPPPPCWDKIPTFTENLLWMLPLKAEEKNWLDLKKKWTRSRRRISCDPQPRPFLNWKGSSGFDSQTSYGPGPYLPKAAVSVVARLQ